MPSSCPNSRKIRKDKFLKVYRKTFDKSKATTIIKAHRSTIMRWVREDSDFRQAIIDIEESWLDTAESELMKQVKNGNLKAIQFLLKSKGKDRGYGDRLELAQTVTKETIDTKRLELFLSNQQTRKALEILAVSSLKASAEEIKDG